ncbi:hypothetical protein G647_03600 [Cladophialophora carrionii CBS 160.54]|uniref:Chromo domain-containing protein n=1 Tax=Cladophialophora carrionii CBS 160.54 TaxID=1279043 RepID=V9DBZ6_9EURO|nr:uncharacterized protein G647_03600 [Cladophialophora carrionii CBS 160.54]ETI24231.1 hypothetical protein G647_03600 [Cladophialophora carrionii CBS 160.54]
MTNPVPKQPGIAEYKHTRRKSAIYSPWRDVPWDEQQALGGEFKEAGEGCWPVEKILEERINRRSNNRTEYLVLWKRHPTTRELWAPQWVWEEIDNRVIDDWKAEKRKKRKRGRLSHGSAVERPAKTRARVTRVLPNSSSQSERQGEEEEEEEEAASTSVSNASAASEEQRTPDLPSSSLEIAETQQEPFQPAHLFVDIPRATVNLEDYESLHSSQLHNSTSSIKYESSPVQSRRKPPTHPQPATLGIPSSSLSTGPEYVPSTLYDSLNPTREQSSPLAPSPHLIGSQSSPAESPSKSPLQNSPIISAVDLQVGRPTHNKPRSQTARSSTRFNNSSYRSTDGTPARYTPLFCSPSSLRRPSASSNSSFGDEIVVNSIESDVVQVTYTMDIDSITSTAEPAIGPTIAPQATIYDTALGGSALPIQESIEDEEPSSNGEPSSSNSKTSSSQQSIENERDVAQIAGLVQPSLPILGPNEYVFTLPCEGKIQSTYADIIKAKEKSIKKFLSRHESIGSAHGSPNRTHERNEMNDMIQRLHDTVTHMDLGLPGFSTQYSVNSQEHAAYANYAGTKFLFLGYLVDFLHLVGVSIVIMSREGQIQDLLEQYLKMKHVVVRRQDRIARSKSPATDRLNTDFSVELVSTWSTHEVDLRSRPCLMIAFDASFDAQDPQVARIRAQFHSPPRLMPVLHLLVANSSEHVDRCLPKSLPSPMRLKALVRYTYSALPNLGGKPFVIQLDSDVPEGRPMDFSDLQKGVRKSPERKIAEIARIVGKAAVSPDFGTLFTLETPLLELTELDETPSMKPSRTTTRPETPRDGAARSRTPVSRADTPSGRKRLLDVDGVLPALNKRQRITPLRDSVELSSSAHEPNSKLTQLEEQVRKLQADLAAEQQARRTVEQDRDRVKEQLTEWQRDHASLQRRYEKRMTKCHELDREKTKLQKTIENNKSRHERTLEENATLKQKNAELQKELTAIREEIKAGGGDAAALETAREEARTLLAKTTYLEKSLENTRKDFEFTRSQYQNASNRATELAGQVTDLEKETAVLAKQASDEKRRLKQMNFEKATDQHLAKIEQSELERKSRDILLKKLEEENRQLKRNRGVQTRGSSVQPPGSPGLDGHGHGGRGTRSRQGSPAPGLFPSTHARAIDRGSLLRNER